MLIFLISAVSALSVNVAAPSAGTIIDSSVTNYNIVFDLNHDTNSLIDANIFLDTDTDNSSFTKKLTSMNSLSIGTQSFSWDTNASDGNYYIYINTKSVDGNTANDYSDKFTVKKITVDSTPPETEYNGFTNDAWRKTSATVTLTCSDSGSGCKKTFYKLMTQTFLNTLLNSL